MTREPKNPAVDAFQDRVGAALLDPQRTPRPAIFGIGRNYAAHARELGNAVPGEPIVFLKPASALLEHGGTIQLPRESRNVQHELELVLLLGHGGRHLSLDEGWAAIGGYGIGIDVTARDIQAAAQQTGKPWTIAKGYDTFAPVSRFLPARLVADPGTIHFDLTINGELRQAGCSRDMIFDSGTLVAYLSSVFTLEPGDLVFTGSPEGVGRIESGDHLVARSVDLGLQLAVHAAAAPSD